MKIRKATLGDFPEIRKLSEKFKFEIGLERAHQFEESGSVRSGE